MPFVRAMLVVSSWLATGRTMSYEQLNCYSAMIVTSSYLAYSTAPAVQL